jgi:hypothetical protein
MRSIDFATIGNFSRKPWLRALASTGKIKG